MVRLTGTARGLLFGFLILLFGGCGNGSVPEHDTRAPDDLPDGAAVAPDARIEVLASGAALAGANGMHFGPDGLLYVASVMGSELVALDPDSGEVMRRFTAADGVIGPDDVAFAPDGAFFWTSILTGEVAGFDRDGQRVVAAQLEPGVNPITFSDTGRLFVAQCFFGDGLFELDPRGVAAPRRIADDLGPGCGLNGMDWGPDGRLYGPRWFTGEVVSFDVDSGERRTEAADLGIPAAVKFDSAGRLHVLDTQGGRLLRLQDGTASVYAELMPALDNFVFDADDRLFISSYADGFVARVEADGTLHELLPGGMTHPAGVTVRQGVAGPEVVVADMHALRAFDAASGELRWVERNIVAVGPLGSVISVAADGDDLLVAAFTENSVRLWSPATRDTLQRYDDLAQPVSAIRYHGRIVVAEHGTGRVIALPDTPDDAVTEIATGLPAPTALATDGTRLFVTDRSRGEVLEIARDGSAIEPHAVAAGLESPEGLALHGAELLVTEADSGRILRIPLEAASQAAASQTAAPHSAAPQSGAGQLLAVGAPGSAAAPGMPPSMFLNGLAAHDGWLYATGETNRVLYRVPLSAPTPDH